MNEIECVFCGHKFNDTTVEGSVQCPECGEYFNVSEAEPQPDESMDGDAASALASAGFGTDEDYEHNLCDEGGFGEE